MTNNTLTKAFKCAIATNNCTLMQWVLTHPDLNAKAIEHPLKIEEVHYPWYKGDVSIYKAFFDEGMKYPFLIYKDESIIIREGGKWDQKLVYGNSGLMMLCMQTITGDVKPEFIVHSLNIGLFSKDEIMHENETNHNAIMLVCEYIETIPNATDILQALLYTLTPINVKSVFNQNALQILYCHRQMGQKHVDATCMLLQRGIDVNVHAYEIFHETALSALCMRHNAANQYVMQMVEMLLAHPGIDVNQCSQENIPLVTQIYLRNLNNQLIPKFLKHPDTQISGRYPYNLMAMAMQRDDIPLIDMLFATGRHLLNLKEYKYVFDETKTCSLAYAFSKLSCGNRWHMISDE